MKSKILMAAALATCLGFSSHVLAQKAQNLGTQKREGVSSKINLANELVRQLAAAADSEGRSKEMSQACLIYLSLPPIQLPMNLQIGVGHGGNLFWNGTNEIVVHTRGRNYYPLTPVPELIQQSIITSVAYRLVCSIGLHEPAKNLARALNEQPTRANEILKRHVDGLHERVAEIMKMNPAIRSSIFINPGNGGFSRVGPLIGDPNPNAPGAVEPGVNYIATGPVWLKEVIFEKIVDYKTSPITIKFPCGQGVCDSAFVMSSDGRQLSITRDGLPFLNDNVVGGIESSFDLGSERTLGTMKKIER